MKSLFNKETNREIITRINQLTPETKNLWGKMSVSHMVTHAQRPLLVAFGDLKLKRGILGILFGTMAKKSMIKPEPFKKNMPTDPHFIVKEHGAFEDEKQKLIALVERFASEGTTGITKETHPFFGKLTVEEWDILQVKHLDHHLRQFGV